MYLYKEYNEVEGKTIKITIWFNSAKREYASQDVGTKGYMATCVPIVIEDRGTHQIETYGAYTGFKYILIGCERQSKRKLENAIKILDQNREKFLNHFRNETTDKI